MNINVSAQGGIGRGGTAIDGYGKVTHGKSVPGKVYIGGNEIVPETNNGQYGQILFGRSVQDNMYGMHPYANSANINAHTSYGRAEPGRVYYANSRAPSVYARKDRKRRRAGKSARKINYNAPNASNAPNGSNAPNASNAANVLNKPNTLHQDNNNGPCREVHYKPAKGDNPLSYRAPDVFCD